MLNRLPEAKTLDADAPIGDSASAESPVDTTRAESHVDTTRAESPVDTASAESPVACRHYY